MQIGKRPEFFFGVCGGVVVVFRVVGLPRQKRTIWGTSCFYFILISVVELLLTFFFLMLDHKCASDEEESGNSSCVTMLNPIFARS